LIKARKVVGYDKKLIIAAIVFYLLLTVLTACGPQEIDVSGTVTHKIELDLSNIERYFRSKCEIEHPESVAECTDAAMTEFLYFMFG
jgi:hypothetical protein